MSEGNGDGAHAPQLPMKSEPRNCIVCMEKYTFDISTSNWCPDCRAAWAKSAAVEKIQHVCKANEENGTERIRSITTSWAVTRRKEVQRDREVAKGCP